MQSRGLLCLQALLDVQDTIDRVTGCKMNSLTEALSHQSKSPARPPLTALVLHVLPDVHPTILRIVEISVLIPVVVPRIPSISLLEIDKNLDLILLLCRFVPRNRLSSSSSSQG